MQTLNNNVTLLEQRTKINANFTEADTRLTTAQATADSKYLKPGGGVPVTDMDGAELTEFVRDTIAAALVAGTNITVTVNDAGDTITLAAAGGGAGGATNLSVTLSPTGVTVNSDTGTDATLSAADATNAGLMLPAQFSKLAGIATGATANATDAALRDRATHTGTQAAATISDSTAVGRALLTAVDAPAQRTALGLGSAATSASTVFATSTQGGKADSALQPGTSLNQTAVTATTAAGVALLGAVDAAAQRTALGLGTAATSASTAFATAAQGTQADTAVQPSAALTQAAVTAATAAGVALLDAASAAAQRTLLSINNVDNTSDANKPVSTAQAAADGLRSLKPAAVTSADIIADTAPSTPGTWPDLTPFYISDSGTGVDIGTGVVWIPTGHTTLPASRGWRHIIAPTATVL